MGGMTQEQLIGGQIVNTWSAADTDEKTILTAKPPEGYHGFHDVLVTGENVLLTVQWGTSSAAFQPRVSLPFRASFMGDAQIVAVKRNPALPASAKVAVVWASAAAETVARVIGTAGTAAPLGAKRVTALAAAVLDIGGVAAIALPVAASLPVVQPATVVSGTVVWELAL